MTVQLDPFHLVRAINCVPPEELVTAFNVGRVGDFSFNEPLTATLSHNCNGCGTIAFDGFITKFTWDLQAQVQACSQQAYVVRGRTSGSSINLDFRPLADFGHDCTAISCGGDNFCYIPREDGYLSVATLGSGLNQWFTAGGGIHRVQCWLYHFDLITDFQQLERLDVDLFTYFMDISLIETDTPSTNIWLTVVGHNLSINEKMKISNTVNYDGTYLIKEVDGNRVRVTTPYVEDETTGTLTPDYD